MLEIYDEITPAYNWPHQYRKMKVATVRHQQTCPVCGRSLVNTYKRDSVWKCKRCWDQKGVCCDDKI